MFQDSYSGLVFHHGRMARSARVFRVMQAVHFLFGVLYALFATKLLLEYVAASPSQFRVMIDRMSGVFLVPFEGIVANGRDQAGHPIAWWIVIALAAYAALHVGIVALVRLRERASFKG